VGATALSYSKGHQVLPRLHKCSKVFSLCNTLVSIHGLKEEPNNPSCTFIKFTTFPVGNACSVCLIQRATHQLQ